MDTQLTNHTVLVTGASGGIGSAICALLLEEGANVIAHFHTNRASAEALAAQHPNQVLVVQADLRDAKQVEAMYAAAIDRFGRIDAVVANAGVWPAEHQSIDQLPIERWRDTMESDLSSVYYTCSNFFAHLRTMPREHASVVIIGSTAALFGEEGHSDYAAAKSAITFGLTRTLKNEIVRLARHGRVNAVCPGWTATPMSDETIEDEAARRRVFATMPVAKIATPADVANIIVFLLSPHLAGKPASPESIVFGTSMFSTKKIA
jgi:3-oxoacyl-[acyl-carrier protein] reductase